MKPEELLAALAKAMAPHMGQKEATGTPTVYYNHGDGGLFSTAGVDQDVLSTVVQPVGILESLRAYPTVFTQPLFSYWTGFRDETGSEPDTVCEDCVVAGLRKGCVQTAQFGRYCRETREFSLERLPERRDNADPDGIRLINPVVGTGNLFTPELVRQNPLAGDLQTGLVELGVAFERLLARQIWAGNPANNNAGGYMEFPGLDILVGTTKVDAISGTDCPSLDSDVKDYAYQDVCTGTPSIVEVLTYLARYTAKKARTQQFDPVDFRWVMREELFYELTSCWPCSYISYRCRSNADTAGIDPVGTFDSGDMIAMRDAMRNGRYLLVDGKQMPVIFDDGIVEDTNTTNAHLAAGEFASDIYLLPFSVRGNYASLYMEYMDFTKVQDAIAMASLNQYHRVTDAGKFLWTTSWKEGCFLMKAVLKPRIILRTPQLAGRVTNVKYVPLQHTSQPFPDDGYYQNGGAVSRSATRSSLYSDWNNLQ